MPNFQAPNFKAITPPRISDKESAHERDTKAAIETLADNRLIAGKLVEARFIAGTPLRVRHNLGRVANGFIPVRKFVNCDVWAETSGNIDYISLICSEDATISLWIF